MMDGKTSLLSMLFVVMLTIFSPFRMALATEAVVLTVRPELLKQLTPPASEARLVRDPFNWPAGQINKLKAAEETKTAPDAFQGIILSGIIWDDKKPLAVINGHLAAVGDKVNLARVAEINKDQVVLEYRGVRHIMQLEAKPTGLRPKNSR